MGRLSHYLDVIFAYSFDHQIVTLVRPHSATHCCLRWPLCVLEVPEVSLNSIYLLVLGRIPGRHVQVHDIGGVPSLPLLRSVGCDTYDCLHKLAASSNN